MDAPQNTDTIVYTYDELGRTKSRTDPGTVTGTTYAYDALGRLTSLASSALGLFTYTYAGVTNRVTDLTRPNGQLTHYTYAPVAADSRLLQIKHRLSVTDMGPPLSQFDYTYDALGNIKTWRQQVGTDGARQYELGYDAADELKSATLKSTDPTPLVLKRYGYDYDPAGNRTANQTDNVGLGASYNNRNQLLSVQPGGTLLFRGTVDEPATVTIQSTPMPQPKPAGVTGPPAPVKFEGGAVVGSGTTLVTIKAKDVANNERTANYNVTQTGSTTTYGYFDTGELSSDSGQSGNGLPKTYSYDAEGRLTKAVETNMTPVETTFKYDGLGRRVQKTSGGVTRTYVYDGDEIVEERVGSTKLRFVHGLGVDDHLAQYVPSSTPTYFLRDHLGSIWQETNSSGAVTLTRQYDPWGNLTAGAASGRYAFTGREWDTETGLYYYRARYYDPKVGRFLREDPIGLEAAGDGLGAYVYARNNPLKYSDPSGLRPGEKFWTIGEAVIDTLQWIANDPYQFKWDAWEWGGSICENTTDHCFECSAPRTDKQRTWVDSAKSPCPSGTKKVGRYHTHTPDSLLGFSDADMTNAGPSVDNAPGYVLHTADGRVLKYTWGMRSQGQVIGQVRMPRLGM